MPSPALELDRPDLVGDLPARHFLLLARGVSKPLAALLAGLPDGSVVETCEDIQRAVRQLRARPLTAMFVAAESAEKEGTRLVALWRAGGGEETPLLVIGTAPAREAAERWLAAGADAYLSLAEETPATLAWRVRGAMELYRLAAENRRLRRLEQRRLEQEHEEIGHLISEQHSLLANLEALQGHEPTSIESAAVSSTTNDATNGSTSIAASMHPALPAKLVKHYRELLKALVVMGGGSLQAELDRLVAEVLALDLSAQAAMALHLGVVEEMVRGMGNRSARHVLNRADLLIVELMTHLAEAWRERAGGG